MSAWRLNWAVDQLLAVNTYPKHARALRSPLRFWYTLTWKLLSNSKKPVNMHLRDGGIFAVSEFMTLYIYKEIFIDKCYDLPALEEQKPVILDVGANTGLFTLRMKQLYPDAHIHCFEPYELNFQQLASNIRASNLNGVKLNQLGVGGNTREEKLFIHDKNIGGHTILPQYENRQHTEIQLVSLKDAFKKSGISKCHLLKLDCEGAEYEIIKSIDAELAQSIERIIFEPSYRAEEAVSHLGMLGYELSENKGIRIAVMLSPA